MEEIAQNFNLRFEILENKFTAKLISEKEKEFEMIVNILKVDD